jgi:hypothetical protein
MFAPLFVLVSCANIGTPSGGEYDLDPPKLITVAPGLKSTNVQELKTITMLFDENVQLDNPSEKVIVTPPQKIAPTFTTINRKVKIELRDTLLPNTTYVMDFTDALADNNEKNVLENFVFSFSTGQRLDTLEVSGKVLNAENLEPVSGIFVGLHTDLNDSAFVKRPFDRISKTNSKGQFVIRGVASNKYRLYALNDANRDYKYDSPSEAVAFLDSLVVPSSAPATRVDTLFAEDHKTVDSLVNKQFTRFLPDNIILRSFTSSFKRQFLQKYERPHRNNLTLYFGAPTSKPKIEILNHAPDPSFPLIEELAYKNDTVKYWITDPKILQSDSLAIKVDYIKTDSLNVNRHATDTLKLFFRDFKGGKKKSNDDKNKEEEIRFLQVKHNVSGTVDILQSLNIEFEEPVSDFDAKKIVLSQIKDSVWTPVSFAIAADSLNPRRYKIAYKWSPGGDYVLKADSAAFHSYYGTWSKALEAKFKVKKEEEYGFLFVNIIHLPKDIPAFVELLDKSDKPIRKTAVKESGAMFKFIPPGTYYVRLVLDTNKNGKWDTGEFSDNRQPEMVYYYHKAFDLKPNWELSEDWDIAALPLDKQKPLEITQNKPQEKKTKRQQLEEEEKKKQSGNKSTTTNSSRVGNNTVNPTL